MSAAMGYREGGMIAAWTGGRALSEGSRNGIEGLLVEMVGERML